MKILTKQDLWDSVIGGSILATGGGGIAPSIERFNATVSHVFEKKLECKLVNIQDIPNDSCVFYGIGAGGGIERELKNKYMAYPSYADLFINGFDPLKFIKYQIKEKKFLLNSWSEIPDGEWENTTEKKLVELIGEKPFAYCPSEIGPNIWGQLLNAARKGKPVVDCDTAGYRAVPELSLTSLNVMNVTIVPAVLATVWGDMLIYEKVLSWQRFEDINRFVAAISGGEASGLMSIEGSILKESVIHGTVSKAIAIGRAVREAREIGKDTIEAILHVTGGYKLFEGKIVSFIREDKYAFAWGETRLDGVGQFADHTFEIWFKNENQISWLDSEPYVTCPDPINIVDSKTGKGLSNFYQQDFQTGREVTVIGLKCADIWRTERGLKIYNPRHFGFDIPYTPIQKFFE